MAAAVAPLDRDWDARAAQEQLAELERRLAAIGDAKLAMQLYLQDLQDACGDGNTGGGVALAAQRDADDDADEEEQQLRLLAAQLSAALAVHRDERAALALADGEEAAQAASLRLASLLEAQEAFDAGYQRPHDAAFARALAACDERRWADTGDWMAAPLDVSGRPADVPDAVHTCPEARGAGWQQRQQQQRQQQQRQQQQRQHCQQAACHYGRGPAALGGPGQQAPADARRGDQHQQRRQDQRRGRCGIRSDFPTDFPMSWDGSWDSWGDDDDDNDDATGGWRTGGNAGGGSSRPRAGADGAGCSSWAAAGGGGGHEAPAAGPTAQCGICFDSFAEAAMVSARAPCEGAGRDPAAASSSAAAGAWEAGRRCGHVFCRGCMSEYARSQVQARKHAIVCPNPSCASELAFDDVTRLLAGHRRDLEVYEYLVAEHQIDTALRFYCPYKDCSMLLERPEPEEEAANADADGNQQEPYECPCCKRHFCLSCGVTGWHMGLTCRAFQALPPEQRSAEDAALLSLASRRQWRRCPCCAHVIERVAGCNHVQCPCGCAFCYSCGVPYASQQPTEANTHGQPGCGCPLFDVPEDEGGEGEAAGGGGGGWDDAGGGGARWDAAREHPPAWEVAGGAAEWAQHAPAWAPPVVPVVLQQAGRRPRPYRAGRFVSRTPCRYSASIYDCPHGPGRCWFWHDEDG